MSRTAMVFQLAAFAAYGLIAGEAFAYRIDREREKTAELMLYIPIDALSQIALGGNS